MLKLVAITTAERREITITVLTTTATVLVALQQVTENELPISQIQH